MNLNEKVAQGLMTTYTGTKTVKAVETTKKEYNDYRGWDVPEGEDPDEVIYLVEYEADPESKLNHQDHKGYITMSPKHVFDKAYKSSGTYLERLIGETEDLKEKMEKLSFAIDNKKVPEDQIDILTLQFSAMTSYYMILMQRLKA